MRHIRDRDDRRRSTLEPTSDEARMGHYYFRLGQRTFRVTASSRELAAAKLPEISASGRAALR